MDVVGLSYVSFSLYNRDIRADDSVPRIESSKHLSSTDLYSPSLSCSRCYPTTSHCRGHIGKVLFPYQHIAYPYRKRVDKLLRVICDSCYLPVREPKSPKKAVDRVKYLDLVRRYGDITCACTGDKEPVKGYARIRKLQNIYKAARQSKTEEILSEVFGVGEEADVLRDYIIVLPRELLVQLPSSSNVQGAYNRVLKKDASMRDPDNMLKAINRLYDEFATMLRDKSGAIRQLLLPRRVGSSVRAVVVPDPTLGICDVGLPKTSTDKLVTDLIVTKDNMERCISLVQKGQIVRISYERLKYKLVSGKVYLSVSYLDKTYDIPFGSKLSYSKEGRDIEVTYNDSNTFALYALLLESCRTVIQDIVTLERDTNRKPTVYVDVSSKGAKGTVRIPLQYCATLGSTSETRRALVHRNPVLSAGSVHVHNVVVTPCGQTISMTTEERFLQREDARDKLGKLILRRDKTKSLGNKSMSKGICSATLDHLIGRNNPVYKLDDIVSRSFSTRHDVNCCISINPVATTTYQADFDGDEMNVHHIDIDSANDDKGTIVADMFKGSVKPIHDGRYGLYCLVTDEVGLSCLNKDYASIILHNVSSLSQDGYTGDLTDRDLLDCGLSKAEVDCIRYTNARVSEYLGHTSYRFLGPHTMLVRDLVTSMRLCPDRLQLLDVANLNNHVIEYVLSEANIDLARKEYGTMVDVQLISGIYSDMCMYLYYICDYHGISFDRLHRASCDTIAKSQCRTKESTLDTIYKSVGFTSYPLPNAMMVSYVKSRFGEGVTEEELDRLSYAARVQVARKAETTASEGDNMRMQCNYMSDCQENNGTWRENGRLFYEEPTKTSVEDLRMRVASKSINTYSEVLLDGSPMLEYRSLDLLPDQSKIHRSNIVHIGQRKLLMAEIEFLTGYYGRKLLVVYIGAASGAHILALSKLFPTFKFHLYDKSSKMSSNLFDKVSNNMNKRLKQYRVYMTPELAERMYKGRDDVLLISDIRNNSNVEGGKPTDDDVSTDNNTNKAIVQSMNPLSAIVKFRLPYTSGSSTLLKGELRLQCWSGIESTETRLICSRPYAEKEYDHRNYEQRMFYHNTIRPSINLNKRVNTHIVGIMSKVGITPHYDMYRETDIVDRYVAKSSVKESVVYMITSEYMRFDISYYIGKRKEQ